MKALRIVAHIAVAGMVGALLVSAVYFWGSDPWRALVSITLAGLLMSDAARDLWEGR